MTKPPWQRIAVSTAGKKTPFDLMCFFPRKKPKEKFGHGRCSWSIGSFQEHTVSINPKSGMIFDNIRLFMLCIYHFRVSLSFNEGKWLINLLPLPSPNNWRVGNMFFSWLWREFKLWFKHPIKTTMIGAQRKPWGKGLIYVYFLEKILKG